MVTSSGSERAGAAEAGASCNPTTLARRRPLQTRHRREEKARTVCLQCPVLETCREFARAHREYGFWGGESEEERHQAGYRLIAPIGVRA